MSGAEQVALIAGAIWLAVLTAIILLLIRQVSLLTVRLSLAAPNAPMDDDGLDLASPVPASVLETLGVNGSARTVVFLSATCAPCRELASTLGEADFSESTVVLIAGGPGLAEGVADLLPRTVESLLDPAATNIAQALEIESTPFGMRFVDGAVHSKAYLQSPGDVRRIQGSTAAAEPLVGEAVPKSSS